MSNTTTETTIKTRIIYYSASTGGFYFSDINANMPDDAVVVSEDTYNTLQSQLTANHEIHPDTNGNPISAPTKPAYAKSWDAATASWTIDTDAKAAAEAAATAKATQIAALQTSLATVLAQLQTAYPALATDGTYAISSSDTIASAAAKMISAGVSWGDVTTYGGRLKLIYDAIAELKG